MPDLLIGYYDPPADEDVALGILDAYDIQKGDGGYNDLLQRVLLALAFALIAYVIFTQIA